MKRYTFIILFLIVLITPFALRLAIGVSSERAPAGAAKIVVITPNVEGIKREFADAFSAWHQKKFGSPVEIDYRGYGGGSEIVRFFRSSQGFYEKTRTYNIDIVWGGGDRLFDKQLKPLCLDPVQLPADLIARTFPKSRLNDAKLYDDESDPPTWYGTALSAFGIVYNKDVLRDLSVPEPRTWNDLVDARLTNNFIAGDPTRSASANQAFMIIIERAMIDAKSSGRSEDDGWADGMGMVRMICSNARYFTDAGQSVPGVVASGDAAVGTAIDFFARSQIDAVGDARMGYLEPRGATAITADPVALVKGAPHRELAIHFIEFLLSEEGQRLWITRAGAPGGPRTTSLRRLPIMRDVYESPVNFTDQVDPFDESFAFASSPTRTKAFNIVGELIETSCMSLLDELRDTRLAIERSRNRDELLAKLAKFPFGQQEALHRQADFEKASPLEKLAMKRRWREEFLAEYKQLGDEASRGTGASPVHSVARMGEAPMPQ